MRCARRMGRRTLFVTDDHGRVWFGIGVLASISLALTLVARRVGRDDDCAIPVSCFSPLFRNEISKTISGRSPSFCLPFVLVWFLNLLACFSSWPNDDCLLSLLRQGAILSNVFGVESNTTVACRRVANDF